MSKKTRNTISQLLLPLEVLDVKSNLEELSLQGKRRGLLNLKSLLTSKRKLRLLLKLKKKTVLCGLADSMTVEPSYAEVVPDDSKLSVAHTGISDPTV